MIKETFDLINKDCYVYPKDTLLIRETFDLIKQDCYICPNEKIEISPNDKIEIADKILHYYK